MTRPPTTTERGLGWEHQQARTAALKRLRPGTPCPHCGHPMHRDQKLDLDHTIPRAYGGHHGPRRLAHATCNRRAGQRIGAARRRARAARRDATVITSRPW